MIGLSHQVSQWFEATPALEPEIRQTIAAMFDDLPYISTDEPGMLSAFLDGVEEPLRKLWEEFGLGVFAVQQMMSQPPIEGAGGPPMRWPHTIFIVAAPSTAVLDANGSAHLVRAGCEGLATSVAQDLVRRAWPSPSVLELQLEGSANWCPTCMLALVGSQGRP